MGILDEWEKRSERLSDDFSLAAGGEINPAQVALRTAGEVGGGVGDIIAPAVSAAIEAAPEFVKKGLSDAVNGVMGTGYAKAAKKWLDDNPEHARDISSAFNAMDIMGAGLVPGAAKRTVSSMAKNMPNQLEGFYGSGAAGQAAASVAAIPSTVGHMAKQAFTPSGQALAKEGIPSRLKAVAKEKTGLLDTGDPKLPETKKAAGFLEGQMDQTSLLAKGAGEEAPALRDIFGNVQDLSSGPMGREQFKSMFTEYKPEAYEGVWVDGEMLQTMEDRVRKAQGIGPTEDVEMVVRHPTALTDVVPESTGGSLASSPAKRMFKAKQLEQDLYPNKFSFEDLDDAKEFMAVRALVDESPVRKDGQPMTKADYVKIKTMGMGDNYRPKESGNKNVVDYYKFKKMEKEGKKFTKPQRAKYEKLKGRIAQQKDNVQVDSKGRLYTQSSHRSAAKGLGGVNDQFVMDMDGNVLHFINDENDLFGHTVPGDRRVISVTPPTRYNVFEGRKNPVDVAGKQKKQAHAAMLEERFGAPQRGTTGRGLTQQMGEAISGYSPKGGAGSAARNVAEAGILGNFLYPEENE